MSSRYEPDLNNSKMSEFKYREEAIPLITVKEGERGKLAMT